MLYTLSLIIFAIIGGLFRTLIGYINHPKSRKLKHNLFFWLTFALLSAIIGYLVSLINFAAESMFIIQFVSFALAYIIIDLIDKDQKYK